MKPKAGNQKDTFHLTVQGHSLEDQGMVGRSRSAAEIVLLHEGLGSVSHWRRFPARVAKATGSAVTVYSRYGCGNSDLVAEPRPVSYMHDEALHALPDPCATPHREANPGRL
jgi:pimeloyl-ACP methyl ester carboxylesterase